MANAVGLNMKITADTAGIGRGINRTEKMLGNLQRSTNKATSALRTLAGIEIGRLVVGGITSITRSLTNAAQSAVRYAGGLAQSIDETAKLAQRTGIAVESLQALQVAASLAGVGNIETALQKVTVAIGNAAESGKTDAFEKLGLDFALLETLSPEEQFRKIAAAIQAMPTQAERAAAAVKLFGRSGVELLPLFASNLEEIEARAKRLGIVLSEDQTGAIEDMNDALSLVRQTFDGIIGQVVSNLAPFVTAITEELLQFVEAFEGVNAQGGTGIADMLTDMMFNGIDAFLDLIKFIGNGLLRFSDTLHKIINTVAGLLGIETRSEAQQELDRLRAAVAVFSSEVAQAVEGTGGFVAEIRPEVVARIQELEAEVASATGNFVETAVTNFNAGLDAARGLAGTARQRVEDRNSPEAVADREAKRNERLFTRVSGQFAASVARAAEAFGDEVPEQVASAAEELNRIIQEAFVVPEIDEEELKRIQAAVARAAEAFGENVPEQVAVAAEQLNRLIQEAYADGEIDVEELKRIQASVAQAAEAFGENVPEQVAVAAEQLNRLIQEAYADGEIDVEELKRIQASVTRAAEAFGDNVPEQVAVAAEQLNRLIQEAYADGEIDVEELKRIQSSVAQAAEAFGEAFGENVPEQVAVAAEQLNRLIQEAFVVPEIDEEELKRIQAAQAAYNTAIKEGERALKDAEKNAKRKEELEKRLADKSLDIESKRLKDLSTLNNQALNIQDLRSGGISQVFASMREDPAIEEYRKQLSELKRIRQEISALGIVAQI